MQWRTESFAFRTPLFVLALLAAGTWDAQIYAQPSELSDTLFTLGTDVRRVFEPVVSGARDWTVQVLADDKPAALGTIVGEDGWILTKASQLNAAPTCRLGNGNTYAADYYACDPELDLALLKVGASGLTAVRWQTGDDAAVGQWLATPGVSGPPVGIGIVSAARRTIPLQRVNGVLGIRLEPTDGPAIVAEIIPDSPAAKAEIRTGDIIQRIGDRSVENREVLIRTIQSYEPGVSVQITIQRGESEVTVSATLSHPFGEFLSRIAVQNQMGGRLSPRRTGFAAALQHDTVLDPELCGGSVVNLDGLAAGINIARAGRTETYAIPAEVVIEVVARLKSGELPPPQSVLDGRLPPPPPAAEPVDD
jgi:serine protease Do